MKSEALRLKRHPVWIRQRPPFDPVYFETKRVLTDLGLHSVCQEAKCPNIGECFAHRTATFLILGDVCTRRCQFCAIAQGVPLVPDDGEPLRLAEAVDRLGLDYVVITSVDRDDLPDRGLGHFERTVEALRHRKPSCRIELLVPDFRGMGEAPQRLAALAIDVLNHNVETVARLYPSVRRGASWDGSLRLLSRIKSLRPELVTKSGMMVGLGETDRELQTAWRQLRRTGCDVLTLGQYLQPTGGQFPVHRYVTPLQFDGYRRQALAMGFRHVEAGPLVRSSYHAWTHFEGVSASAC